MATKRPSRRRTASAEKNVEPALSTPYHTWLRLHAKIPEVLYHYTNAQGLLGILKSGFLWATNSRFLNDATEIVYATRLFRRVAAEELVKAGSPLPPHAARWKEWLKFWLDDYEAAAKVYVACFCADGDLLSQWRGYGATGGGYSLGFTTAGLPSTLFKPRPVSDTGLRIRKVIYNPNTQEGLVRERVKALCSPPDSSPRSPQIDAEGWFSIFFSESLNCFKHPAFEQEEEWRAIQFGRQSSHDIPDLKFEFRTSGTCIIDYTLIDLKATEGNYSGKLPISVVRYGPTLDPKTTERSLKILLGAHGYDANLVEIVPSKVPFTG